jgi:Ser/Thr protein kinase RdoA (MazF antagonist)
VPQFWVCAPLATLGAAVLVVLRPWVDRGEKRRQRRRRARIDGFHEACALTDHETAQWQDIAREYRRLGRKVSR